MRGGPRRGLGTLAVAAIASLSVALHGHWRALEGYREWAVAARPALVRLAVIDRMLGAKLSEFQLVDSAGDTISLRSTGSGTLVWWVSLDDCVGCLSAQLGEWELARRAVGARAVIVLAGHDPAAAARQARRAGVRGRVLFDPGRALAGASGQRIASVLLASDADGTVVGVDARPYGSGDARCGWSAFRRMTGWLSGQ